MTFTKSIDELGQMGQKTASLCLTSFQFLTYDQQRFIENCPSREQFVYTWEP